MIARFLTPFRIAMVVGLLLSAMRFQSCTYLASIDARALDYRLLERGVEPASSKVVIVAVDDASVDKLGRWPWSRAVQAELLKHVTAGGPAVVGFDMVQSEATQMIDLPVLRKRLRGLDERTWGRISRALTSADDTMLVDAVGASRHAVLGYFFDFNVHHALPGPAAPISTYNIVQNSPDRTGEKSVPEAFLAQSNLPALSAAARAAGYFNFFPDPDGSFRRVPLAIRYHGQVALPLSLAMLHVYQPQRPLAIRFASFGVESVLFGSESIPVAENGQMLINYRGPGGTFHYASAADVIAGKVPPATFRNKLVLVGVTATALADVRVTPFDSAFPGVEIHATVLDNVLRNDFIEQPKWTVLVEIAVILASVLTLGVLLHYVRGVSGFLGAAALAGGYLVGSQWLFLKAGLPLGVVYPLLAITLTYVAISLQHYVVEVREKHKIRDAFGLYLTPSLARLVSERPEMLKLGGDTRELTVLFTDVRGFTTISERFQNQPEMLVELLNEFLGGMTDVIFQHDGTLDKYVGDEIMAVWGAPVPQPDHARRACLAALGMLPRLRQLNEEWRARDWPALRIGIGLNTGPMVVGNMGSARRLSYTVIGDNVNLGARLEGLNKLYGSGILASETTVHAAADAVVSREIDLVRVKGKVQPVRIYELLGAIEEREQWATMVGRFEEGLRAYRERRWVDGVALFEAILVERPEDGPSKLYRERCRVLQAAPPEDTWDGVTTMEVK